MRFSSSERAQLRCLLEDQRNALLKKAADANGEVNAEEFQAVERLDKLCGMSRPNTPALAVEILMDCLVVFCILSLLFFRVTQTGIELQGTAAKIRFSLAKRTQHPIRLPVKWIAIQGHRLARSQESP